jgi:hypothetical protein
MRGFLSFLIYLNMGFPVYWRLIFVALCGIATSNGPVTLAAERKRKQVSKPTKNP